MVGLWTGARRWAIVALVPGGVLLAAAGCMPTPTRSPPAAASATTAPELPALPAEPPPRPARKPPPPGGAPAAAESPPPGEMPPQPTPEAALTTPPAIPPPPPPPATTEGFERLAGLDRAAIIDLLGAPRERAEAPPATIWRYASHDCELEVYFYLDLQTKEMRALHYEVRTHDAADRPQQCYEQLIAQRRARAEPVGSADRAR
jgi:hypothetical protein